MRDPAIYDNPTGYVIAHSRAFNGSTCYFGPFPTEEAMEEGCRAHPEVRGSVLLCFLDVNWMR